MDDSSRSGAIPSFKFIDVDMDKTVMVESVTKDQNDGKEQEKELTYDEIRQQNIERNNAFLGKLGLDGVRSQATRAKGGTTSGSKRARSRTDDGKRELVMPTRRSSRVKDLPPMDYKEKYVYEPTGALDASRRYSQRVLDQPFDVDYKEEMPFMDDTYMETEMDEFSPKTKRSASIHGTGGEQSTG